MRYADKLLSEMVRKGFNGAKLARVSGVSDSEISRILAGKSQPGLENAMKLARAVGVSLDYLADDALEVDPARSTGSPYEQELLELAHALGLSNAVKLLFNARSLGFEVANRRLLGLEGKPIIEKV